MATAKRTETTVEWWKKWGKRLFFGGLILLGIAIMVPESAVKVADSGMDSSRKYSAHYNWSKDRDDFIVKEVVIPEMDKGWVSIAVPPFYRMETSRTFDVEYDFGGKDTVKEGPDLPRVEAGPVPSTFDVRATGSGGVLKIWLHKNPQAAAL